jgi:hypothetical protein
MSCGNLFERGEKSKASTVKPKQEKVEGKRRKP